MNGVLLVSGLIAIAGVIGWIALLIWASVEDGREQQRRDRQRRPR